MKILVVGTGISGCTAACLLSKQNVVTIIDTKPYVGGLCTDIAINDFYWHLHGPHIFHTSYDTVWEFLSEYTSWIEHKHYVTAVTDKGIVPVPYTAASAAITGISDHEQIRSLIYDGYSKKMWGASWDKLPDTTRNRVPIYLEQQTAAPYFTDKYQALPSDGYSYMMWQMISQANVILGAGQNDWLEHAQKSDVVIYCGRPDHISWYQGPSLKYKSLSFTMLDSMPFETTTAILNDCRANSDYIRYTSYPKMFGSRCAGHVMAEKSRDCGVSDVPYYPIGTYRVDLPPNFFLLGRTATMEYLNMDVAVLKAMQLAEKLRSGR